MRFKVFGTQVYISFLFVAVIAFMLATDRTGLVIPTLFASFIHEAGHLFAMWVCECQPKSIKLIPASVQITRGFSTKPNGEVAVSLCGPVANLLVFAVLLINYLFFKNITVLTFAILNLILCIFNLLPVSGLDGGTLLTIFIAKNTDLYKAQGIVRIITAVMSAVVFVLGVYMWTCGKFNISVFIVAVYLLMCCMLKM